MDNFFSLALGKENTPYYIFQINSDLSVRRRLLELGFTSGSIVKISKKSQSKGVFLLEIRNYVLALKREEVSKIMVKK